VKPAAKAEERRQTLIDRGDFLRCEFAVHGSDAVV
jgi:hypothetical protein